jgi:ABC-type glutathione transport system ATPase component
VAEGIGLLVVEQNLGVAARAADRLLVMASARIEEEMQAAALLADEDAQRRYLGVEALAGTEGRDGEECSSLIDYLSSCRGAEASAQEERWLLPAPGRKF